MFSPLLLLTLTLSAIATSPHSQPFNTTQISHPSRIAPRFKTGGFYDKCKDVRFYLAKEDDKPGKNSFTGYKSSPWLVAKCPDKNGKYLCTWLALSKCLVNSEGELYRGAK
ncbi:NPS19 [Fusarium beomiforme]|uniref:NPS19 n=1 Tax=Fusarium beomiforme TaxID=44412 RepID=A0A9P5A8A2_9HYPO|nr:NPS19 [Fusarium beomiforme]